MEKTGGFAFSDPDESMRKGDIVGAVEPGLKMKKSPGRTPLSYTGASRLGTNCAPSDGDKADIVCRGDHTFEISLEICEAVQMHRSRPASVL
jgi:hypothetical protein